MIPRRQRHSRTLRISGRVYKALLAVYPEEFRKEYGTHMERAFRDLCREGLERSGTTGLIKLWVHMLLDLTVSAFVERSSSCANRKDEVVKDHKLAGIGFVLLLPPLSFVCASLLKYGLGIGLFFDPLDEALMADPEKLQVFNLVSPIVFLGGLGLALALNAYTVLRLNVGREDRAVVGTVRLRMKPLNIAVVAVSSLLLVTLLGYAFVENLTHR